MTAAAPPSLGALPPHLTRPDGLTRLSSNYGHTVSLLEENLPDAEEWEPSNGSPPMTLDEIEEAIGKWEEDLRSKGREISGRTM